MAQVWSSPRPATCRSVLASGYVWVRLWQRWSFSSSCPGSYSASPSLSLQATLCPVWRASLVWCSSQPNTRWMLHLDRAGTQSARCARSFLLYFSNPCIFFWHIDYTPIRMYTAIIGHIMARTVTFIYCYLPLDPNCRLKLLPFRTLVYVSDMNPGNWFINIFSNNGCCLSFVSGLYFSKF